MLEASIVAIVMLRRANRAMPLRSIYTLLDIDITWLSRACIATYGKKPNQVIDHLSQDDEFCATFTAGGMYAKKV